MIGEEFIITLDSNEFTKGNVLKVSSGVQMEVVKIYNNWWRRFLRKLVFLRRFGYRDKIMDVKVKIIKYENSN